MLIKDRKHNKHDKNKDELEEFHSTKLSKHGLQLLSSDQKLNSSSGKRQIYIYTYM
jgi:hypothetical protein